jgi:hypothetical protein
MRVREHHGWGHGLPPGTDRDINCRACRREQAEGQEPVITGSDTAPADPEAWVWK